MKRSAIFFTSIISLLLFSSHELFLKTNSYFLKPGQATELYLYNGTFDKSENIITRDRILDATVAGPKYEIKIGTEDYYDKDNITYFQFKLGESGTYVAGISTAPKLIELNAEEFNDYLEHEGLQDTLKERRGDGNINEGAVEKYSKHVKALVQAGELPTDDFNKEFGYPIEFIPLVNPYRVDVGQPIAFKLLRNGKPLANHIVHYSTSEPGKDAHDNEDSTRTDDNGILTMIPSKPGNWYVATIHMEKSLEEGLDYESNWATLTFGVR